MPLSIEIFTDGKEKRSLKKRVVVLYELWRDMKKARPV
jgi:hypothetical protein